MSEIPLILLNLEDDGCHLLVDVFIFNQSFRAVLDTGASKTVFDKSTIERYIDPELLMSSDKLSTGLGTNTMTSHTLIIPDLQIGDLHLKNYELAILDLSAINFAYEQLAHEPVIGVIGGDLLHKYQAVIDYKRMVLSLNLKDDRY